MSSPLRSHDEGNRAHSTISCNCMLEGEKQLSLSVLCLYMYLVDLWLGFKFYHPSILMLFEDKRIVVPGVWLVHQICFV